MTTRTASAPFLITKEYRRFAEFCDACRRHQYIGLCHGSPGVGKTLSATHYARWDLVDGIQPWERKAQLPQELMDCRTVLYTPPVVNSPSRIGMELTHLRGFLSHIVNEVRKRADPVHDHSDDDFTELIIVDEADRLKLAALEQLRDIYDRGNIGLILVGMPGIEKRLSRYAQFYSRVGFVHHYRALNGKELTFLLEQKWQELGLTADQADFTDAEAMAAVIRITGGNFRLLQRLFTQISRILEINQVKLVTQEVVEAARESLVIGIA
ncbi:MAG: AAA family ATPase [Anaerolineae bacterium]